MSGIAANYPCPACPETCDEYTLPVVKSEYCPQNVQVRRGEIKRILIAEVNPEDKTKPLGGPADWTSIEAWTTAIDNDATGKVKSIYGIGDMPDPTDTYAPIHDGLEALIDRLYTMNFSIVDTNDVNYNAARALQCGGTFFLWYEDRGNYLYGGENGIKVELKSPRIPRERGNESYLNINTAIIWHSGCDPERVASPFTEGPAPEPDPE